MQYHVAAHGKIDESASSEIRSKLSCSTCTFPLEAYTNDMLTDSKVCTPESTSRANGSCSSKSGSSQPQASETDRWSTCYRDTKGHHIYPEQICQWLRGLLDESVSIEMLLRCFGLVLSSMVVSHVTFLYGT